MVSLGHQEAAVSWFLVEGDGWMIAIGLETERMVSILLGEKEGGHTRRTKKCAMELIYNKGSWIISQFRLCKQLLKSKACKSV